METMKLNLEIPASLVLPLADRLKAYAAVDRIFSGELITTEADTEKLVEASDKECPIEPGTHFLYYGVEFVALGMEQGGVLAVSAHTWNEIPFDEDGSNDWRKSSIKDALNGDFLECLDLDGLLPFDSDLTTDDGLKNYGTSTDYVFLLSCDLYRKYRELMPEYDVSTWTLTPWSCHPSIANLVRVVNASTGAFGHNYAYGAYGAAPACLFNPKSLKSATLGAGEGEKFKILSETEKSK